MNSNKKLSFRNPIASIWSMISFRNDGSKLPVVSKWYMTVASKWRRKIFVSKIILVSAHPENLRTKNTYQGPYGLIHGCERRKRHERECQYFDHRRSTKAERGIVQKMLRTMDTNAYTLWQLPEPQVLPCGPIVGECSQESCVKRRGCWAANRHQNTSANAQERSHNYGQSEFP